MREWVMQYLHNGSVGLHKQTKWTLSFQHFVEVPIIMLLEVMEIAWKGSWPLVHGVFLLPYGILLFCYAIIVVAASHKILKQLLTRMTRYAYSTLAGKMNFMERESLIISNVTSLQALISVVFYSRCYILNSICCNCLLSQSTLHIPLESMALFIIFCSFLCDVHILWNLQLYL